MPTHQDHDRLQLNERQASEVRRRLAEPDARTLTLAEFNERLKRRYGIEAPPGEPAPASS